MIVRKEWRKLLVDGASQHRSIDTKTRDFQSPQSEVLSGFSLWFLLILAVPGGARKQNAGGDEAGGSFGSDRAEIFVLSLRLLIASDR